MVKEKAVRLLILAHFSCCTVYICLVTFWSDRNSLRLNKTGVVAAVWMPIYARADRWTQTVSGNSAAALKGQQLFLVHPLKVNSLSNMFCKILTISSSPISPLRRKQNTEKYIRVIRTALNNRKEISLRSTFGSCSTLHH